MAQIKKGFIAPNAIDGSKLRLLNNEAIRAQAVDGSDVELMKIDINSVLQFLRTPQVSADPVSGNDISRKSWVDAQVASEATARAQAVSAEATTRAQADTALQASIAALQLDSLTDVEMSSPAAGDMIRYVGGKWKKESPISAREAGSAPAVETVRNYAPATPGSGTAWIVQGNHFHKGQTFTGISGSLSKFEMNVFQFGAATGTTTVRLYETPSQLLTGQVNLSEYPLGPVLATASLDVSTIGYGSPARWAPFVFSTPAALDSTKNYLILIQHGGSQNWLYNANTLNIPGSSGFFKVDTYSNGGILAPVSSSDLDFKLTTLSGGGTSLSNAGGVVKSNTSGFIDQSLLQYNVNFGDNKLSGVAAPTSGTDAANKTWVEGQVSAEAALRTAADTTLQNNINTEKGRIDAILSAATTNADSFKEIVDLINSVDATNDSAFAGYVLSNNAALAQEVSNREAAVSAEETARQADVAALQSDIDDEAAYRQSADEALSGRLDTLEGSDAVEGSVAKAEKDAKDHADSIVSTEEAARIAGDNDLSDRLDVLEADPVTKTYVDGEMSDLQSQVDALSSSSAASLAAETAARTAEDEALQSSLDQEVSNREAAVLAEQTAREEGDQDLQDQINALVISTGGDTAAEAAIRLAADANIQAQVDAEKARIDAILDASTTDKDSFAEIVALINSIDTTNDTAFAGYVLSNDAALAQETLERETADAAETAARQADVAALQGDLADEATARQEAVAAETAAREADVAQLQSNIDSEASVRQSADDALDARVDALEAVSEGRAKFVITQTDLNNQYLNLSHVAKPDSTFMFYGPLYLHEGDDYTVSTVGGVTRLTFTGRIASGQPNQPIVGDTIYVRYKH